jgi:protoporphyrinogen oxidase
MDIIIGAGVSGIAYASFTDSDYAIIEQESEKGGYCKTVRQDGFTWDYSGHFFHFQNKDLEEYVCKNMASDDILICSRHSQIKYKNRYIDFPFQKNIHQLKQSEFIDCLYDLFNPPRMDHSTFKRMLYANFGQSIADKFLIPYNEKLYACDLDTLDMDAMGRFFPYASKEEIIRNFKNSNNSSYNSSFVYPRYGAIEYINSLFEKTDKKQLLLNKKVYEIDVKRKMVKTGKGELKYDRLIATVPFPNLLKMCRFDYDETIYSWNKVLVFNLGFDGPSKDNINHWVYFPSKKICFYRVGYYSNIFSEQRMSLYVELGFNKEENNVDKDIYLEKALNDLKNCGIINEQKLLSYHSVLMDPAYVHITKTSQNDVSRQKEKLAEYDIFSIGRYGSWTYCSIEDNISEAKRLAEELSKK